MSSFYRAFEDRHRGSRAVIAARLRQYMPFLQPLAEGETAPQALDLGCGRGEWLELLGDAGFVARGVDLDEAMLEPCRALGLDVALGDAIEAICAAPDASLDIVSAFHVVEHLPFGSVQTLAAEALRALRPGGLLILETPNPENLIVGTANFHMDPTHERPLPMALLQFCVEFAGFGRVVALRLQEQEALRQAATVTLLDVLGGVSPDYAIVAQKAGDPLRDASLTAAFARPYGLSLADLGARHEARQREQEARQAEQEARQAAEIRALHAAVAQLQREQAFQRDRSLPHRLLFNRDGRPVKLLRTLLFHTNGKPRGMFRAWVLRRDGRPRRMFRHWMTGEAYQALPRAVRPVVVHPAPGPLPQEDAALTGRAKLFLGRLRAVRSSPRPPTERR
jgi:O-antigen chain-terminating methyltransferase